MVMVVMIMVVMVMISVCANALYMVMMAFLWGANFMLLANNLYSVLAELAVHIGVAIFGFIQHVFKGL